MSVAASAGSDFPWTIGGFDAQSVGKGLHGHLQHEAADIAPSYGISLA